MWHRIINQSKYDPTNYHDFQLLSLYKFHILSYVKGNYDVEKAITY